MKPRITHICLVALVVTTGCAPEEPKKSDKSGGVTSGAQGTDTESGGSGSGSSGGVDVVANEYAADTLAYRIYWTRREAYRIANDSESSIMTKPVSADCPDGGSLKISEGYPDGSISTSAEKYQLIEFNNCHLIASDNSRADFTVHGDLLTKFEKPGADSFFKPFPDDPDILPFDMFEHIMAVDISLDGAMDGDEPSLKAVKANCTFDFEALYTTSFGGTVCGFRLIPTNFLPGRIPAEGAIESTFEGLVSQTKEWAAEQAVGDP